MQRRHFPGNILPLGGHQDSAKRRSQVECPDISMMLDLISEDKWSELDGALRAHWSASAPSAFPARSDPCDLSFEENILNRCILAPIVSLLCGKTRIPEIGEEADMLKDMANEAGLNLNARQPGQICGRVFKNGELTYSCRDCANDPTCVMCYECFSNSEHRNHKYKMHASGGSGYCDCGDSEAWHSAPYCKLHKPPDSEQGDIETEEGSLPAELERRLSGVMVIILRYCVQLLTWEHAEELPPGLKPSNKCSLPFQTMLFNDEYHTYDQVIKALKKAIDCSEETAMFLATVVDREGRSSVRAGTREDCEKVKTVIREKTTRTDVRGPLYVETMTTNLVAHQNLAIKLLAWLYNVVQEFPPLGRIVGKVFMEEKVEGDPSGDPMSVIVMLKDMKLWKGARSGFHQVVMGTVLMDMDQKKLFAAQFTRLYASLMKDFVVDSHDHSLSVAALTVQMYTVPTVGRFLIATEDALNLILRTLLSHCEQYHRPDTKMKYNFNGNTFPNGLRRALHVLYDVKYLLNTPPSPEEWTPELRHGFMEGVTALLEIITNIQGMDTVVRHADSHPEYDIEWETAFNIQLRLQVVLTLIQAWTATDAEVLCRVLRMVLSSATKERDLQEGYRSEMVTVANWPSMSIIFDVSTQKLSIHIPIVRLVAALFVNLGKFGLGWESEELALRGQGKASPVQLMDFPLRIIVMVAQVNAGMWRKNGFSLLNQIHNYGSPLCRMEMFDRDIQMLQMGGSLIEPKEFVINVLHRFGLSKWAVEEYSGPEEESSKQIASLVESFLQLIIVIYGERWVPGIGEGVRHADSLRREVLHVLCRGPTPYSKIDSYLPDMPYFEKLPLEEIVRQVGDFRQPTGTSAGVFELKPNLRGEYNTYFYHYSKTECSEAEQEQHKKKKDSTSGRNICACSPPPICPKFTKQFDSVKNILSCDVMIEVLYLVLKRCSKKSRVSSDAQLHRALFLIGMALNEEERDAKEGLLTEQNLGFTNAATKPNKDRNILTLMTGLVGTAEANSSAILLTWVIAKFKEVQAMHKGTEESVLEVMDTSTNDEKSVEEKKQQKQRMAELKRNKAMEQMARLQKQFIKQNRTLFEQTPTEEDAQPDDPEHCSLVNPDVFPVCLGPNQSGIIHQSQPRKVTCILCQETDDVGFMSKAMVYAAYVQRSTLFSKAKVRTIENKDSFDPLFMPSNLFQGIHTSTCGHTMHAECWQQFHAALVSRESRRQLHRRLFQYILDVEGGEYSCPLCKKLSNTVLPILPPLKGLGLEREETHGDLSYPDWMSALGSMVDAHSKKKNLSGKLQRMSSAPSGSRKRSISLVNESGGENSRSPIHRSTSTSAEPAPGHQQGSGAAGPVEVMEESLSDDDTPFVDAVEDLDTTQDDDDEEEDAAQFLMAALFPQYQQVFREVQSSVVGQFQKLMRRMSSTHERVPISTENYEMVKSFAQAVYTNGLCVHPNEKNPRVSILSWQTTAYTLKCIAEVLKAEDKPLFGAFASRQKDCFYSLVRYGACCQFACKSDLMRKQCLKLLSPFLASKDTAAYPSVLNLDIFTTLVEICLSFGCLYVEEPDKWTVPSGGLNDFYLLRLMLSAYLLQLMVTWKPVIGQNTAETPPILSADVLRISRDVKETCGKRMTGADFDCSDEALIGLGKHLKQGLVEFLRTCALFFHALTLVPAPEALKDPSIDEFVPLCRYLGLPDSLEDLVELLVDKEIWKRWCGRESTSEYEPTAQPVTINRLQKLPKDFSDLIHAAAQFSCPSMTTDESRMPTMCLVCGEILCSQGYCCQKTLGKIQVGACTHHAHKCTAGSGIFLRIRDCQVILQHNRHRGCFRPAPFCDQWGETDSGFRRGNPLFLNEQLYKRLEHFWLHHSVPEEVTNQLEMETRFLGYDWVHL